MDRSVEIDELVECWTLLADEQDLVAGKRGATRRGFALLLKFYSQHGRFPRGRAELPDEVVAFVARQVGVAPSELGLYEWSGRTVEFHRSQVRRHLGFRECSVEDADKLASWLAAEVCEVERQHDRAREQYDQMIKYATAIRSGTASTRQSCAGSLRPTRSTRPIRR